MTRLNYGTAGFRYHSDTIIEQVAPRIVYIIAHFCRTHSWDKMGLMITASHNPVDDNGIKLVNRSGEMLEEEYEKTIVDIINQSSTEFNNFSTCLRSLKYPFELVIGYDTRPSSNTILDTIICEGLKLNAHITIIGLTSTPLLHLHTQNPEVDHLEQTVNLFDGICHYNNPVYIDCANGVGYHIMECAKKYTNLDIKLTNKNNIDLLNDHCGAEYVHKTRSLPSNFESIKPYTLCASFDGDADRLIIFYTDKTGQVHILDGDKIGALITKFIVEYSDRLDHSISVGFIQTAYANGASTSYIKNKLQVDTCYTATGVKYLHRKAKEYDIGVYFESNGHGTVLFNNKTVEYLKKNYESNEYVNRLYNVYRLINQKVGDALFDLLCILYILEESCMSLESWNSLYDDYSVSNCKIYVKDKSIIKTNRDETKITHPVYIQDTIDGIIKCQQKNDPQVRAFIRPSGTEDCVRLYTEGSTPDSVNYTQAEILRYLEKVNL